MNYIDLSMDISQDDFDPVSAEIVYTSHREGADILGKPIGINHLHFPDNIALSLEHVHLSTHTGTHIDAPHHYGPICEGEPAKKVSELPLHWFNCNGVLLSCIGDLTNGPIDADEVQTALNQISYELQPLDIVLLHTGADKLWGTQEYFNNYRGVTADAIEFITSQGVKVIGIDSFSMDAPFDYMLDQYKKTQDNSALWPAHLVGRQHEYCQIERLVNLDQLEKPTGFQLICFPIKIAQCDAGWCRVVALEGSA